MKSAVFRRDLSGAYREAEVEVSRQKTLLHSAFHQKQQRLAALRVLKAQQKEADSYCEVQQRLVGRRLSGVSGTAVPGCSACKTFSSLISSKPLQNALRQQGASAALSATQLSDQQEYFLFKLSLSARREQKQRRLEEEQVALQREVQRQLEALLAQAETLDGQRISCRMQTEQKKTLLNKHATRTHALVS